MADVCASAIFVWYILEIIRGEQLVLTEPGGEILSRVFKEAPDHHFTGAIRFDELGSRIQVMQTTNEEEGADGCIDSIGQVFSLQSGTRADGEVVSGGIFEKKSASASIKITVCPDQLYIFSEARFRQSGRHRHIFTPRMMFVAMGFELGMLFACLSREGGVGGRPICGNGSRG